MDISKKDWKLFRERLSGWQENYMEGLVKEYANFLNDDKKPASEKFWELEKRIKEDKRHPGVVMELKKSEVIWDIVRLIRLKVMACAFGMEACKHYYSVRYVRLPDLLLDLQAARDNGTFSNVLKKYTKPIVLILDEWLLLKLTEAEARNLFELIHKRRKKSSTIFCSQFRESEWYQQICDGESTLADAIMDRISYDSYKIDIESVDPAKDLSMREVYGLDPAMAK